MNIYNYNCCYYLNLYLAATTFEAVYRLDLLPTFAAYFMVNHVGGQYVMISSGPGTGELTIKADNGL